MQGKRTDLNGHRFGRLVVVADAGAQWRSPRVAYALWHCRCDCGNEITAQARMLKRGRLLSCGCLRIYHGHNHRGKRSKTYRAWVNMISRCSNPNIGCYRDYGGRGIQVCDRWYTFSNFLADMGECPPGRMLERLDNNGDYTTINCCWATPIEQANNKRNNRHILFRGKTMSIAELARRACLPYYIVQQRITKYGWSVEAAATTPIIPLSECHIGHARRN